MTLRLKISPRILCFLAAAGWALVFPLVADAIGRDEVPAKTAEQTAMLHALDDAFVRFDALLAKDENVVHAASVKGSLEALKQRRTAFEKIVFDQAKYDELRFDVNVAYQRLNLWLTPPPTLKSESTARSRTP